jgi:hypothetical protein
MVSCFNYQFPEEIQDMKNVSFYHCGVRSSPKQTSGSCLVDVIDIIQQFQTTLTSQNVAGELGWTRVLRNGTTVHCHYWLLLLWRPLNVRSDEFSLTTKTSCFNSVLVSSIHLSSKSYQLIDIYSVCMCCWNVAAYKWKVHNGKINIISFVVKFRCRNYSIQLNAIFW